MALTVNFWTTSKKENSTAIPTGNPTRSFACELKSDSGILSPVLEIGLPMSENPAAWNYAQSRNTIDITGSRTGNGAAACGCALSRSIPLQAGGVISATRRITYSGAHTRAIPTH